LKTPGSVPLQALLLLLGIVLLVRLSISVRSPFVLFQPELLAAALFLYAPFVYYRRGKAPSWLRAGTTGRNVVALLCLAAGGALAYFLYTLLPLPPSLAPHAGPRPPLGETLFRQALLAALPEEVFFRGYLYDAFEEKGWEPVVPSSVLFAAAHLAIHASWYRALTLFPGLLLGGARKMAGNIYVPFVLHLLFNLLPWFAGGSR
jgi:membrane protease YdiL (CAAX protease family)